MAEVKVTKPARTEKLEAGREYAEKLQQLARSLVSSLYMLVRSVKMYSPDNAVFDRPLSTLRDTIGQILAYDRQLELQVVRDSFYLNRMLVKVDVASLDNVRFLAGEMQAKELGGFVLERQPQLDDLKAFIAIFAADQKEKPAEDGLAGRKLVGMRVTKFAALREKLKGDKLAENTDRKVDRKRFAMVCYARAIYFLRSYMAALKAGKPLPMGKAARIARDLVDVSFEHRSHFTGMTTLHGEEEYQLHHQVNTALAAIVFGNALGFSKPQLCDLAITAMFHDCGTYAVPQELLTRRGALAPEEWQLLQRVPLHSAHVVLQERNYSRAALLRLAVLSELKQDFGKAVRDEAGRLVAIEPAGRLSVYARIIAICACFDALTSKRPYRDPYGPTIALTLMWSELRHRFDPVLLELFMKVMKIQETRFLTKAQQTIEFG